MPPKTCTLCSKNRAILKRPKTGQQICKDCFFLVFETEVHNTIMDAKLFNPGERVAIGASGGKGELNVYARACCNDLALCRLNCPSLRYEDTE